MATYNETKREKNQTVKIAGKLIDVINHSSSFLEVIVATSTGETRSFYSNIDPLKDVVKNLTRNASVIIDYSCPWDWKLTGSVKTAENKTVNEVLGLNEPLLDNTFIWDWYKHSLVVGIESANKKLTSVELNKIYSRIKELESKLLEKYPEKDFVEIEKQGSEKRAEKSVDEILQEQEDRQHIKDDQDYDRKMDQAKFHNGDTVIDPEHPEKGKGIVAIRYEGFPEDIRITWESFPMTGEVVQKEYKPKLWNRLQIVANHTDSGKTVKEAKIFEKISNKMKNINATLKMAEGETSSDKLEKKIEDEDSLELVDIMEDATGNKAIEKLFEDNIKFLVERDVGKDTVSSVTIQNWEMEAAGENESTDKALGSYDIYFKDDSTYLGNFIANGFWEIKKSSFALNDITIGSTELKYFGSKKNSSSKLADDTEKEDIELIGQTREGVAKRLVTYTYKETANEDPSNFVDFVIGGFLKSADRVINEADLILDDYKKDVPWLKEDKEFNKLCDMYETVSKKSAPQKQQPQPLKQQPVQQGQQGQQASVKKADENEEEKFLIKLYEKKEITTSSDDHEIRNMADKLVMDGLVKKDSRGASPFHDTFRLTSEGKKRVEELKGQQASVKKAEVDEKGNPTCRTCGKPLVTGDHGWYCENEECPEYDKDIPAYEKTSSEVHDYLERNYPTANLNEVNSDKIVDEIKKKGLGKDIKAKDLKDQVEGYLVGSIKTSYDKGNPMGPIDKVPDEKYNEWMTALEKLEDVEPTQHDIDRAEQFKTMWNEDPAQANKWFFNMLEKITIPEKAAGRAKAFRDAGFKDFAQHLKGKAISLVQAKFASIETATELTKTHNAYYDKRDNSLWTFSHNIPSEGKGVIYSIYNDKTDLKNVSEEDFLKNYARVKSKTAENSIPSDLEDLAQEARQYDNAELFIEEMNRGGRIFGLQDLYKQAQKVMLEAEGKTPREFNKNAHQKLIDFYNLAKRNASSKTAGDGREVKEIFDNGKWIKVNNTVYNMWQGEKRINKDYYKAGIKTSSIKEIRLYDSNTHEFLGWVTTNNVNGNRGATNGIEPVDKDGNSISYEVYNGEAFTASVKISDLPFSLEGKDVIITNGRHEGEYGTVMKEHVSLNNSTAVILLDNGDQEEFSSEDFKVLHGGRDASVKIANKEWYLMNWEEQYIDHDPKQMAEKNVNALTKTLQNHGAVSGETESMFGRGGVSYEIDEELQNIGLVTFDLGTQNKEAFLECLNQIVSMNRGEVLHQLFNFNVPGLMVDNTDDWSKVEQWMKENETPEVKSSSSKTADINTDEMLVNVTESVGSAGGITYNQNIDWKRPVKISELQIKGWNLSDKEIEDIVGGKKITKRHPNWDRIIYISKSNSSKVADDKVPYKVEPTPEQEQVVPGWYINDRGQTAEVKSVDMIPINYENPIETLTIVNFVAGNTGTQQNYTWSEIKFLRQFHKMRNGSKTSGEAYPAPKKDDIIQLLYVGNPSENFTYVFNVKEKNQHGAWLVTDWEGEDFWITRQPGLDTNERKGWLEIQSDSSKKAGIKLALTTWYNMKMEQPKAGWKVKNKVEMLEGTVIKSNEKTVLVKFDREISPKDFSKLAIDGEYSDIANNIYEIYAGDGFGGWGADWELYNEQGERIIPKKDRRDD